MNRKISFALIGAAIMALCACTNLPNYTKSEKFVDIRGLTGGYGLIQGMPVKNYETKGLVFVTINIDSSYPTISNVDRSIVADELLKKAQEIGADDIVNVRVYRKDIRDISTVVTDGIENKTIKHKYEYHGSATAIKYTGTIMQDSRGGLWIAVDEGKKAIESATPNKAISAAADAAPKPSRRAIRKQNAAPAPAAE